MHFSEDCLARGWTVTGPPNPASRSVGGLRLGCARLCGTGWLRKRVRYSVCQMTSNLLFRAGSSQQVQAAGDSFFWLLKVGQFEKTWHHDEQGRRTHNAEAAEPDSGRCPQIWTSSSTLLKDTLLALSGNQTVDAQGCRGEITRNDPGHVGDYVSISSGSLSPNLEEMWRYGCP